MADLENAANARVDEELAGAGASGVGTTVGHAAGVTTGFQEGGFGFNSDIAVTEAQKFASGLITMSAATLKTGYDSLALMTARNTELVTHLANLSNQRVQDDSNKAGNNLNNLAADRMWNLNETDFYAFVAAAVAAEVAKD